ncbi:MAG: PAS domain S-box protein [Bacteroidia bacterium]|nr:PAS domain S-box protein [Bacteroidia bacterium]
MKASQISYNQVDVYQLQSWDLSITRDFDNLITLLAQICEVPILTIALNYNSKQLFLAKTGIELNEIPLTQAFIAADPTTLLIIPDALKDLRFHNHALVTGSPDIRFCGSQPLLTEKNELLGHLTVYDKIPRVLSEKQLFALQAIAKQVVALLRLRSEVAVLKKADVDSRSSDEQMNTIFYNAIDAVIIIDDKGSIVQWNPKAEVILGWSATEAIGKSFYETVIPDRYRDAQLRQLDQYKKSGGKTQFNKTIELLAKHKNNSEFDIALGISPISLKGQSLFICFISDITDRKQVTDKLDKQKEFYENILNKIPTDIAVFDNKHKYIYVNPLAIRNEELRKFIIGKDDFEYAAYRKRDIKIAQMRRKLFLKIEKSGKEIRWEDSIKDPDGNMITHLRRLFPVFNETGSLTMVIGFGIDITERKIMEEKQTELVKQLSAQNTQLVDFCNIVSHNLRAPLVNMSMLVKFIEESDEEEDRKLLITKLNPVIDNLHTTFNELVESIQIKQDLEIKSENINLENCLKRTLDGLEAEVNKSEATIKADFEDAPTIFFPPKYLFSIFHNLLSNALKYRSPERKLILKIKTIRVDQHVILSVKDNGLGIDLIKHKDNFLKIGKVFHRNPNAKGFGLFMTKTQVEAMNGRIWAESVPGEGSIFYIEFKNQNV